MAVESMKILVTGASGYIGAAVTRALQERGHRVVALLRNDIARARAPATADRYVIGDLRTLERWLPEVGFVDGVIHTAATFDDGMAAADAGFIDGMIAWLADVADANGSAVPFLYTGGTWLYGNVGDDTAIEGSAFDPLPDFAYMLEQRERLFATDHLAASIVHPAMTWDADGGVLAPFIQRARAGEAPQVAGNLATRWPLVHRDDLAGLYVRALEAGVRGRDWHGVAEPGVAVGLVAAAIARAHVAPRPVVRPLADVVALRGRWAAGFALDQTMDAPATRRALGWEPRHVDVLAPFKAPRERPKSRWRLALGNRHP